MVPKEYEHGVDILVECIMFKIVVFMLLVFIIFVFISPGPEYRFLSIVALMMIVQLEIPMAKVYL